MTGKKNRQASLLSELQELGRHSRKTELSVSLSTQQIESTHLSFRACERRDMHPDTEAHCTYPAHNFSRKTKNEHFSLVYVYAYVYIDMCMCNEESAHVSTRMCMWGM